MKPNAPKNRQLIKKFPFITQILASRMEPHGGWREGVVRNPGWVNHAMIVVDDLTIRVQKADRDLMFRRAFNSGLGDSSFSFHTKGSRKNQVMRRGEYAFAIGQNGQILNRVNFPRNDDELRDAMGEVYAWTVLWRSKVLNANGSGFLYGNPLWKQTEYIIWVTVETWHIDTKDDDSPRGRFGQFLDRSVSITIYGKPEEGFEQLQQEANVYENLYLDSRLIMRGAIENNHDIIAIEGMLAEICIQFQDQVYFNGMRAVLAKGKFRGASGQFGPVQVLCAEMCGYERVMLEDSVCYVTFQLRPDSTRMYVLGQQGTLPQIRSLVKTVISIWNKDSEARNNFKPDNNVTVL